MTSQDDDPALSQEFRLYNSAMWGPDDDEIERCLADQQAEEDRMRDMMEAQWDAQVAQDNMVGTVVIFHRGD